jgi:fructuronate reductase
LGAFHRAHQACYLDEVLARTGGDWRICGISCRSSAVEAQLQPQNGLYSIVERSGGDERYRIIGSIAEVLVAPRAPELAIDAMARGATNLITLTVTERAYQRDAPDVAHDLAHRGSRTSAMGLLAAALLRRFEQGIAAPTVLSCDNLRNNGEGLRALMIEFAANHSAAFTHWIEREVCFPNSMVDRIVPATTAEDLLAAEQALGLRDEALVVTEPYSQWVIEDRFAGARPALELAGVQLVRDVRPFELAKLRLLNGSHSTLAYLGSLLGHHFVHEAIADPELRALITQLMGAELAPTLPSKPVLTVTSSI